MNLSQRSGITSSRQDDEGSLFNDGSRAPIRVQTGFNLYGGFMDCAMEIMEGPGFRLICECLDMIDTMISRHSHSVQRRSHLRPLRAKQRLAVNDQVRLIICVEHEHALREEHVVSHLKKIHGTGLKMARYLLEAAQAILALCIPAEQSTLHESQCGTFARHEPVLGLPVMTGFQCPHCGACGTGKTFEKNHFAANHPARCVARPSQPSRVMEVPVQQIYGCSPFKIIRVDDAYQEYISQAPANDILAAFQKVEDSVQERALEDQPMTSDPARSHPFNSRLQWYQFHGPRSFDDLMASVALPFAMRHNNFKKQTPVFGFLRERVVELLDRPGQNRGLDPRYFSYCKAIGMGDGCLFSNLQEEDEEDESQPAPSAKYFKPTLQPRTIDKYARIVSQLLAQVLRTAPEPESYKPPEKIGFDDEEFEYESALDNVWAGEGAIPLQDFAFSDAQLHAASRARTALVAERDAFTSRASQKTLERLADTSRSALTDLSEPEQEQGMLGLEVAERSEQPDLVDDLGPEELRPKLRTADGRSEELETGVADVRQSVRPGLDGVELER